MTNVLKSVRRKVTGKRGLAPRLGPSGYVHSYLFICFLIHIR